MSDILDSRDLQKRLEELEELRDAAAEEGGEPMDESDAEELKELETLSEEVSEWRDGATLIPESDWVRYCQELCEDIGDVPKDLPHYIVIDWDATADNIRADYGEAEYRGTTYLYRDC